MNPKTINIPRSEETGYVVSVRNLSQGTYPFCRPEGRGMYPSQTIKFALIIGFAVILALTACNRSKGSTETAPQAETDTAAVSPTSPQAAAEGQYDSEDDFQVMTWEYSGEAMIYEYLGNKQTINIPPIHNVQYTDQLKRYKITTIGEGVFREKRIVSVTIPNSVILIEGEAFYNNQLTNVTIPESVTNIGTQAFDKNPLTSITIGANVMLNNAAFDDSDVFNKAYNNNDKQAGTYTLHNGVWSLAGKTSEFRIPPKTHIEIGPESMWNNPDIRIWGWSKTGNVALSTEDASGSGIDVVQFIIINLVTDEIVFKLNNDAIFDKLRNNELDDGYDVLDFYKTEKSGIMAAMKNNSIEEHHTPFLAFPLVMDNFKYTAHTRVIEETEDEKKFDIIVSRNGKDKVINTAPIPAYFNEDHVIGYYKSPFENRILIVSGATKTSHNVSYRFIGCHLTVGFN